MRRTLLALLFCPVLLAQKVPHTLDSYTVRSVIFEADSSFSRYFLQHYILIASGQDYAYPKFGQRLLHLQALSFLQWYLVLSYLPRYREDGSVDLYVLAYERTRALQLVGGGGGLTGEGGIEGSAISFAWPQAIVPGGLFQFDIGLRQGLQLRLPYLFGSIMGLRFALANQLYPIPAYFLDKPWPGSEESAVAEILLQPYPSLEIALGSRALWLPTGKEPGLVSLGDGPLEATAFARTLWDHYFVLAYQNLGWKLGARGEYFLAAQSFEFGFDASLYWSILPWLGFEGQLAAVASLGDKLRPSSWFRLNYWLPIETSGSLAYSLALNLPLQIVSPLSDSLASVGFGILPSLVLSQILNWQQLQPDNLLPQLLLFVGPFVDITEGGGAVIRLSLQPGFDLGGGSFLLRFSAGRYFARTRRKQDHPFRTLPPPP